MIKIWQSCLQIYNRASWQQELLSDLKSSAHNYTQHNTVLSHQIITLWGMGQMLLVMGVIILIRVIMILITIGTGPSLRQPPATVTLLTTIIVIFDNFHNKYLYWAAKCHLCIKTSLGSELLCLGGSTRRPNGGGGVAKQLGDRSNAHLANTPGCICNLLPPGTHLLTPNLLKQRIVAVWSLGEKCRICSLLWRPRCGRGATWC